MLLIGCQRDCDVLSSLGSAAEDPSIPIDPGQVGRGRLNVCPDEQVTRDSKAGERSGVPGVRTEVDRVSHQALVVDIETLGNHGPLLAIQKVAVR